MKGYPYWKVGLGFLLCPGIASVIAALVGTYYQILNQKISFLMVLGFFAGTSPVIVFFTIAVNIPPAFILSMVLLFFFRPFRSLMGLFFVSILGGSLAFFWAEYISPMNKGKDYWQAISENWLSTSFASALYLARFHHW
ncbi:hypothetical protein [Alcaligenes sp. PF14]|uniref:hypothetical protein n=1 Tax=Alcaligenes sp. PF14 TaxID=3120297 RepID=UPI00301A24BF